MSERDERNARIEAILGVRWPEYDSSDCVAAFFTHLGKSLRLPCEVTGIGDFRWEELFLAGRGSRKEYTVLRQTQPSSKDTYQLLGIEHGVASEWMMFELEDLAAHVRRKSDRREFYLGLSEIKAVDQTSANHRLLDDYAVWFKNSR